MLAISAIAQPGSFDAGQPISFTCNAAGGVLPYSYSWAFGDGMTGTGQSVTHSYGLTGVMSVICTVTDSLKSQVLGLTSATIISDPSVTSPVASPHSIDLGQTVEFASTASGGSGGYRYSWLNLPTGCNSSDTASISCYPTAIGTFLVEVNVTDSNGFPVVSSSLSFVVYSDPSIAAVTALPNNLDVGQAANLAISASGGYGALSYSYSGLPPGCTTADLAILSCTPSAAGTYSVTGTVRDVNNFSVVSNPFSIVVNPDPTVTIAASPSDIDVNQEITFSISADQGTGLYSYSYQGLPFGCLASNAPTLSCTPITSGDFTVHVTVTDETGGTATSSVSISVNPDPTIVSFNTSSSNINTGQQATFSVSTNGGTQPLTYSYSGLPPSCYSTNSATLSCTPSTTGSYIVQVIVSDHAGKTATSFVSINVSSNTILGLAPWEAYSVIAGIAVAVLSTGVVTVVRARKQGTKSK
jgi:hypothetical protein